MERVKEIMKKPVSKKDTIIILLLVTIATLLALKSSTSILNTTKYLETDVSVWVNIAKKMQEGNIIYKDIFDHKGPVIYFLYFVFYSVGGIKGIGGLEYLCELVNVCMLYMIARKLTLNKDKSLLLVALIATLLSFVSNETPGTESIALPFIFVALYGFIKFMKDNDDFSWKESLYTRVLLGNGITIKTKFSSSVVGF